MKKVSNKILIIGLIVIGLIFAFPSMMYLKNFNSIDGYRGTLYYFIHNNELLYSILGAIIFAILLTLSFLIYFKLIKNSNKFTIKNILLCVLIVGFAFLIALPNTSTDVFYYMGTGRVLEEYGQNPYYFSINDVLKVNSEDIILRNSGPWMDETVVYGPLWVIICFIFNKICFGSATLLLYIFKLSALIFHVFNCYLIYKITKKKKFAIMYGFNPLVLLEFLINAHNDIYLVFFVLLAIYFLKNKKNIWLALVMLAISVGIKHLTLILVPILVLYYLQGKKTSEKLIWITVYAVFFLILLYIMYIPFINSALDIFSIIAGQQSKAKDSIYLVLFVLLQNDLVVSVVFSTMIFVFGYYYIITILKLFMRDYNFRKTMQTISWMLLILIFGVLTNIGSWYLSWLFISLYWLKGKDIKLILWIQFLYELTYAYLYLWHTDSYNYTVIIIPTLLIGVLIRMIYLKMKNKRKLMIKNN